MTDWAIPQQAKLKYTQLFNQHDRSRSGFLSGLQCRDILLHSGLPRNVLAEIWNLSDIDSDGQLTREEFILAMYLTNNVMAGHPLPSELSPELIPPSYRRARSTSATSVHSATSVGSLVGGQINDDRISQKSSDNLSSSQTSGSILTTNSFEDKRRENYERGRAELERRRMKIIEQQMAILKDQLASSKKEVAEAKSKIDAMRTERDTKMGLMTSLDAQLKTFKDRMAFLSHEEQNLIAIAKDLNLVNPSQAELDNLATQAKQQSIDSMKEKINEFSQQKEKKKAELQQASERLEKSKQELDRVSVQVGETYEKYKEKVSEAKVKREEFLEESKSKAPDLDSVWDSQPTFAPTSPRLPEASIEIAEAPSADDPWASSGADSAFKSTFPASNNELDQAFSASSDFKTNIDQPQLSEVGGGFGDDKFVPPEPSLVKKYRVLYAFAANYPDELDLEPGDIVTGIDHVCEPGWLMGEASGKKGLFPKTYVEEILNDDPFQASSDAFDMPVKPDGPASPISGKQDIAFPDNTEGIPSTISGPIVPQTEQIQSTLEPLSGKKYKAIYEFNARENDELDLCPGDIIIGVDRFCEAGWLVGELNGKRGLFPETYVEEISLGTGNDFSSEFCNEATNNNVVAKNDSQSSNQKTKSTKKAEVGTVIANYKALGQEQLNLEKGQLVLIRRKMDSGWWEGEVQVKAPSQVGSTPKHPSTTTIRRKLKLAIKSNSNRDELANLIYELIDTEIDYVNDLKLCHSIYIKPLSNSFNLDDIFTRWTELIDVHETNLNKISASCFNKLDRSLDYGCVLALFKLLLSSIGPLYTEVCSKQNESLRRFEVKCLSDIRFKQLVNDCQREVDASIVRHEESRSSRRKQEMNMSTYNRSLEPQLNPPTSHGQHSRVLRNSKLPVSSYMIKPMQRITKYGLLFDRASKISASVGDMKLQLQAREARTVAEQLCRQVNEVCGLKQGAEENKRRLRWAQDHIMRPSASKSEGSQDIGGSPLISNGDQSLNLFDTVIHNSSLAMGDLMTLDDEPTSLANGSPSNSTSPFQVPTNERMTLDSDTSVLGMRKLLKAGCFIKSRSNREVALFLFNDMLLITKVRGGSIAPALKAEDIFASERAKKSYYKLIREPILLENLILREDDATSVLDEPQVSYRCSWPEQQFYTISFVDGATGEPFKLCALSKQEQLDWIKALGEAALEAKNLTKRLSKQVNRLSGSVMAANPPIDIMDALLL